MAVKPPDNLFYIMATQPEMYDLGNIKDITHYLLYNQTKRILVDITADVKQAPLLSKVSPMAIVDDKTVDLIEALMKDGVKEPDSNAYIRPVSYVKRFEYKKLEGRKYGKLAEAMTELYETRKELDSNIKRMRKLCKNLELLHL